VASLPAEGGELAGACRIGGVPWRVEIDVKPSSESVGYVARILRQDTLIAAPSIVARWGERAIVSSRSDEGEPLFLFVVVQTDRAEKVAEQPDVGVEITSPKLVSGAPIEYPASQKSKAISGQVVVSAKIGTDGTVRAARVVRSLGAEFDAAALAS